MSCQHLVCAMCAGPVAEGRCPTCRAARDRVHSGSFLGLTPPTVLLLAALLALVVLLGLTAGG